MKLSIFATLALTSAGVLAAPKAEKPKSYDGFKVFRVSTHGETSQVESKLEDVTYQPWEHSDTYLDVVIGPDDLEAFEKLGLDARVMHKNLGQSISEEAVEPAKKWKRQVDDLSWYDSYHNYEDHIQYFNDLQRAFPNNSKVVSSGRSYQNRNIFGLHVWGDNGPGNPAVLYHATVHAREWIAAPTVEYITLQLLQGNQNGDETVSGFLNKYDFFIFPIVNPDGFLYSQTTDRLWRKNRQPPPSSAPDQTCYGIDINRNWEFAWDATPRGHSTNPCAQAYRGQKASDTPENQGLDKFVRQLRDDVGIKLFIDWHSYGQYILSPFGYKETLYAPELGKWTKAATLVSEEIRDTSERGVTYTYGPSGAALYPTTGAAPDHVYSIGRAEFSYTIELSDTGEYGFVLPPSLIRSVAEEQWIGQKVLLGLLDEEFFDGVGPAMYVAGSDA
ncbi:zinc carboxypeptidase domain-containing protein [Sarocladium implicatum]|nr:zinc carboxypeptidase domain-containing protein [Sarocladium implicatum]